MHLIKNCLIVVLALAVVAVGAVLPFLTADVQDEAARGNVTFQEINAISLEIGAKESGLNFLQKLAMFANGEYYTIPNIGSIHTEDEIVECAMKELSFYQETMLVNPGAAFEIETVNPGMVCFGETYYNVWIVSLIANTDTYEYLVIMIDDETGKILNLDYQSDYLMDLGWDHPTMCQLFLDSYILSLGLTETDLAGTMRFVEPAFEEAAAYAYDYASAALSWGDALYGETVIEFVASDDNLYMNIYP